MVDTIVVKSTAVHCVLHRSVASCGLVTRSSTRTYIKNATATNGCSSTTWPSQIARHGDSTSSTRYISTSRY